MAALSQPDTLQIGEITVFLRRSARRRTLGLEVRHAVATAHAPLKMPEEKIVAFLYSKRFWLAKHLQSQQQAAQVPSLQLGDTLGYLGEELTLRGDPRAASVRREQNDLIVPASAWHTPLKHWTQRSVLGPYTELVEGYAARLGAQAKLRRVMVSDTRSRWGSCTQHGDIRLHWALSRAPLPVLHYVALHEAAHLLELNHSARYWAHVSKIMPEHVRHRAWLREYGAQLTADKS